MSPADTVNTWFRERIACGAVARDTQAYNQVSAALPDLIERLGGPAAAAPADPEPAPAPAEAPKGRGKAPADPPSTDTAA
jgi:hypothetical protein